MHPTVKELVASVPVVTDGAWGTQLQTLGLPVGACPDLWNLERPECVREVAESYVAAGSQIILTNTFGANRIALTRYGAADRVAEINRRGVELSRAAAGGKARVFASVGPSGTMLFLGQVTEAELAACFKEQIEALAEAGADGIVIETMSDLAEATIAVTAARAAGLPVVACMTFTSGKQGPRTMMGTTCAQAAQALEEAGADVIGANCGEGIEGFRIIVEQFRQATRLPLWVKPNAGVPELVDGKAIYRMNAETFASYIPDLVAAGASFIGGCCGTSPEFISQMVRLLSKAH